MIHHLKIYPKYFDEVLSGNKTFEIRKFDRDFKVGDTLILEEYDVEKEEYTNRVITCKITYILSNIEHYGLDKEYCIMSMKVIHVRGKLQKMVKN